VAILPSYYYLSGSPATRFKNPQAQGFAGFFIVRRKAKKPLKAEFIVPILSNRKLIRLFNTTLASVFITFVASPQGENLYLLGIALNGKVVLFMV
jgi:hypothetical protein